MKYSQVALIGFPGAGKSTVAPVLAQRLGFTAVDADRVIIERSQYPSIPAIFETLGESTFRQLETSVLQSLAGTPRIVIATGGGSVTRPENTSSLKNGGSVLVFLHAPLPELRRRLGDCSQRPVIRGAGGIDTLYHARYPLYCAHADITVETMHKDINAICDEIIHALEAWKT
jgi:shikimate kinase